MATQRSFALYDTMSVSQNEPLVMMTVALDNGSALITLTALSGERTTILATESTSAPELLSALFTSTDAIVAA